MPESPTQATNYRELPPADLVPAMWRSDAPTYVFNPAVTAGRQGDVLFYRVVSAGIGRRIAACRLDPAGLPVAGTAMPFSDLIGGDDAWYADPRIYRLAGESFVYWNTGYPEQGMNRQFLIRVDLDTLRPVGSPIEMILDGPRQRIEKNWILFEHADAIYAIYSIAPHRVLRGRWQGDDRIVFTDAFTTRWQAFRTLRRYGPPRGGAQPLRRGDRFYHFCHASSGYPSGSTYVAQCYEFDAQPPFAVLRFSHRPLPLPNPRPGEFRLPRLNPRVRSVVYPSGNIASGEDAVTISYGLNDEAAFLATLPFAEVERHLDAVGSMGPLSWAVRLKMLALRRRLGRRFGAARS